MSRIYLAWTNFIQKLDPDIIGTGGEIAVAKYFKTYPDLSIGPHRRGYDLQVNGTTIDVKTTTFNPGYLQAKLNARIEDADIYILVHAHFPEFTIIGFGKFNLSQNARRSLTAKFWLS